MVHHNTSKLSKYFSQNNFTPSWRKAQFENNIKINHINLKFKRVKQWANVPPYTVSVQDGI